MLFKVILGLDDLADVKLYFIKPFKRIPQLTALRNQIMQDISVG